ncbi:MULTISPECIES: DUF3592 domain-containing protein [unclassified Spirillospora]|uniref:DUF3592 domain-containing protein n=1 Tax=unclassified Spirillospora TaxID=2642701 RepID=UPI003722EE89
MGNLIGVLLGVALVGGGVYEVVKRLRLQSRMLRAAGVFVGRDDVLGPGGPSTTSRVGRFRFTTAQGRPVEAGSSLYSFPGPKPGRSVTVVYDPAQPEETAERLGVHYLQLVAIGPLLMAVGVAVAAVNAAAL